MSSGIYDPNPQNVFALGNEAISRGLVESGLQFVSCYPGTPTSDILPTLILFSKVLPDLKLYTEWSTNEAIALEAAAAAAQTGIRCAFTAKHVGLNVAMDAFMTLAYSGVKGGLVMIIGDDPSLHSSQNEQDTRYLARAGKIPVLEPSNPQECYSYAKLAFEISEKFSTPIIIRITTRVAHARQSVDFGIIEANPRVPTFERDVPRLVNVPAFARQNHVKLVEKFQLLQSHSNTLKINRVFNKSESTMGIITSGVSFAHTMDALQYLNLNSISVLKISFYPVPEDKIREFLHGKDTVFVIEEVEPILENEVRIIAQVNSISIKIVGKREGYTQYYHELNASIIISSLKEILNIKSKDFELELEQPKVNQELIPSRPPVLCAGCPHRSSFLDIKKALGRQKEKETIFASDIGCYALGLAPPANVSDLLLCMGASIGMATGLSHTGINRPIVAIIGDSTFWHSGLPGLANAVYNNSDITILVVDNKTTAMTGMQENPSSGVTAQGIETTKLSIEKVCEAMNVPTIVVDPWETEQTQKLMKEHINNHPEGPKVIVSRRDCMADALRRTEELEPVNVIQDDCVGCGVCVDHLGCPAIIWNPATMGDKHPKPMIDPNLCSACTVCIQICPVDAIKGHQIQYKSK